MKRLLITILVATALYAQNPNTAKWPGANAVDTDLFVANNQGQTTLNGDITSGATSIVLTSGTHFVAPVIVTIDAETISCTTLTTNTLSVCTRATQGTTAAAHTSGTVVYGYITAYHYNQVAAEIKAIEANAVQFTGTGSATFTMPQIFDGNCAQGSTTITTTGAAVGNIAEVAANPALPAGVSVAGKVTATNTVTVEMCNWSGGPYSPASEAFLARVIH